MTESLTQKFVNFFKLKSVIRSLEYFSLNLRMYQRLELVLGS